MVVNDMIETNRPDWKKDDEGYHLVEHDAIVLTSRCYLNQLSIADLKVLTRHLDLDVEFEGRGIKDVLSEIKSKTLQKYPAFQCTKSGNLIIDTSLKLDVYRLDLWKIDRDPRPLSATSEIRGS